MTPIMLIANIAIEGAIMLTAAYLDAINPPLQVDPARPWQIFVRKDAMRSLAALVEEDRHRVFVAGYHFMAPDRASALVLDNLIEEDAGAVDDAWRAQWQLRCRHSIPNG